MPSHGAKHLALYHIAQRVISNINSSRYRRMATVTKGISIRQYAGDKSRQRKHVARMGEGRAGGTRQQSAALA